MPSFTVLRNTIIHSFEQVESDDEASLRLRLEFKECLGLSTSRRQVRVENRGGKLVFNTSRL
jgi:hypothetical protein